MRIYDERNGGHVNSIPEDWSIGAILEKEKMPDEYSDGTAHWLISDGSIWGICYLIPETEENFEYVVVPNQ